MIRLRVLTLGYKYQKQHLNYHTPLKKPKKADLPTKICAACKRPFTWRKKWERCWDEVLYCSEGCKKKRN